jgi:hypothetical protein
MNVCSRGIGRHQRLDAAAAGMTEHDDVLHLQRFHGELQRGAGTVRRVVVHARWNQVGHVAHHEQIARLGVGEDRRIDPRIGAGDHHDLRPLLDRELVEERLLRDEAVPLEFEETGRKLSQRHCGPERAKSARRVPAAKR